MAIDKIARGLAGLGRNGDSVLVHMHPSEVSGLQALAESQGTSLTVNPHTGMPEAFNLMDALGSLAPTLVGMALAAPTGGASLGIPAAMQGIAPIAGGALTGAMVAKAQGGNPLLGAATGGLGGYGGSGIADSIAKMGTAPTAADLAPVRSVIDYPSGPGVHLTNGPSGFDTLNPVVQAAGPSFPDAAASMTKFQSGLQNVAKNPMEFLSQNKFQVGAPLGMAALAGLEPSDLNPTGEYEEDKYDPNKTLNLSGDTGLRLLAEGGMTSGGLSSLYANPDGTVAQNTPAEGFGAYRLDNLAQANTPGFAHGGYMDGPGDGVSDSIPATIADRQPARLADGEFVLPARIVSEIGNGSTKAGAKRLYAMMDRIQHRRNKTTGKDGIAVDSKAYKELNF